MSKIAQKNKKTPKVTTSPLFENRTRESSKHLDIHNHPRQEPKFIVVKLL